MSNRVRVEHVLRCGACIETQSRVAHELHRRDDLDVLRVVPERPQSPGDDLVARSDGVDGACEGVDHLPVVGG